MVCLLLANHTYLLLSCSKNEYKTANSKIGKKRHFVSGHAERVRREEKSSSRRKKKEEVQAQLTTSSIVSTERKKEKSFPMGMH
jgi:hypothetical protein